jgi:hypothetical protein
MDFSDFKGEKEVLMLPGRRLKVINRSNIYGFTLIELLEEPPSEPAITGVNIPELSIDYAPYIANNSGGQATMESEGRVILEEQKRIIITTEMTAQLQGKDEDKEEEEEEGAKGQEVSEHSSPHRISPGGL